MDAYIGEIRSFAFTYIPQGWLPCYGQLVYISQYQALYALLGNTYGGVAQNNTFGLPNLQAMAMIGLGTGPGLTPRVMVQKYGTTSETLSSLSMVGGHTHTVNAMVPATGSNIQANAQSTPVANNSWLSQVGGIKDATHYKYPKPYIPATTTPTFDAEFAATTVAPSCGGPNGTVQAHNNLQPYLVMRNYICWNGVFPPYN